MILVSLNSFLIFRCQEVHVDEPEPWENAPCGPPACRDPNCCSSLCIPLEHKTPCTPGINSVKEGTGEEQFVCVRGACIDSHLEDPDQVVLPGEVPGMDRVLSDDGIVTPGPKSCMNALIIDSVGRVFINPMEEEACKPGDSYPCCDPKTCRWVPSGSHCFHTKGTCNALHECKHSGATELMGTLNNCVLLIFITSLCLMVLFP